jgi:hypothetical protein
MEEFSVLNCMFFLSIGCIITMILMFFIGYYEEDEPTNYNNLFEKYIIVYPMIYGYRLKIKDKLKKQ